MITPNETPRRLVILVPGLRSRSSEWKPLRDRLATESPYAPGEAYWVTFEHGSGIYSFGGLRRLAEKLNALIETEWLRNRSFEDVVLVAHSIGGLIVREAYLLASGAYPETKPSEWPRRTSRIVLFASINRGIHTQSIWWLRPIAWSVRTFPFLSSLRIADAYRGSNFLTNLRVTWIRHIGTLAKERNEGKMWPDGRMKELPKVVQVLGTEDSLVRPEDSKDILGLPEAHHLHVYDADHSDVYKLGNCDTDARFAVFRQAFCGDFPLNSSTTFPDSPIRRVIFILHGIRASNTDAWISALENHISNFDRDGTIVRRPTYGYFTVAQFALPSVRRRNIAIFQDWYTELLSEYPWAEFSIVAHSNGTYILGHSLLAIHGLRFSNIVLVGSVLPQNFWNNFERSKLDFQTNRIWNHRANRDWSVALLCSGLRGIGMRDIGTSGFAGFHGDSVAEEVAYYDGGHSEALNPVYHQSFVDFVLGRTVCKPRFLKTHPGLYRQLSNLSPYLAVIVMLILIFGCGYFVYFGELLSGFGRLLIVSIVAFAIYVFLDTI